MNKTLLADFFSEEGDSHACRRILDAILRDKASRYYGTQKFSFNRINITLDFEKKEVVLEDDLTIGAEGEYKLKMDEFEVVLRKHL